MNRKSLIEELRGKSGFTWDMIIIGGGATGMGIALDGVSRGYSVLLLEQSDFAKGTSSRSTKLVHGGVRYMAQGDLLLVMEALHERGVMLKNAPHLTSNQEFIIPVYTVWDTILYTVGLKFYDLMAGGLSLGKSHYINCTETLARLPELNPEGLRGGIVYHDGQFDDSRMVISLARACTKRGGIVLNYFRVTGFTRNASEKIDGVEACETISGEEFTFRARVVINAAGVFADNIHRLDNPDSGSTIRPSQGVHIVLDRSFLRSSSALMIPKTDDGRVLFAIPWYDRLVVGTTDTPLDKVSEEPVALDSEISFILNTAGKYLVKAPGRVDILSVFAGLRPLAANPANPASTKEVSRRHKITFSPSNLLSIVGGKWTTYRRMAEETIDRAIIEGLLEKRKCVTATIILVNSLSPDDNSRFKIYGDKAAELERMIKEKPDLGLPLDERLPYTRAEIIWICRNEMPVNIEDILARRTRSLFIDARASMDIAAEVAGIMAEAMGYEESWKMDQLESYRQLAEKYI
jgi:glycerol-3-phosphate dehydrogenase